MNWQRFKLLIARWIPKSKVVHPYPWDRFDANYPI